MCGVVGMFMKEPELEVELGALLVPMLEALAERGPDSTGLAIYDHPQEGRWRISLRRRESNMAWAALESALRNQTKGLDGLADPDAAVVSHGDCAVLTTTVEPAQFLLIAAQAGLALDVVAVGRSAEVVKDVGGAADVCRRMAIGDRTGYQAIGHTRMATESAVTVLHSHPFSPAPDLNLVHNGSFSNHASVRRRLQAQGIVFESDNDSEVAARLIAYRLALGDSLQQSIGSVQAALDGFFTLLVATASEFVVVRDAFACKPAAVAETDQYVAVASEYRALAGLPGIDKARVFEPVPEIVYSWTRSAAGSDTRRKVPA